MKYCEIVAINKDKIDVQLIVIINNKTLFRDYSIYTNLHLDFGISKEMFNHLYTSKKKDFNKKFNMFEKITGRKFRFCGVDNCENYTRLCYRLKKIIKTG
jgi:hypothetical protein